MAQKALVIGAGISGLAAAVRLRVKGYTVEVFESNDYPGGKLTHFQQGAYRFDAGPSLFTMPHYVDELFEIAGLNPRKFFNYLRKGESCRYFWSDGTKITAWAEKEAFAREVEQTLGVRPGLVIRKLQKSERMYELAGRTFLEKPLNHASTWLSKDAFRSMLNLHKLGLFSTMHQDNKAGLGHPKLVQLFDRYATYNGSDPYRAPGVLNIIPHLEHGIGTFHPVNGMHDITDSIYKLAEKLGVTFHFNEAVEEILIDNRCVTGLRTSKGIYHGDLVVSNMDITPTYRKLLPKQKAPERILGQERSSSALIFYWGIKREFPELGLHNIFFSENYKKEFQDIFNGQVPATDPTIYVNITSKDVSADAPAGRENWFVMVNVPGNTGLDWAALIPQYRTEIIRKLSSILGVDLQGFIENESTLSPLEIELKTSSLGGSLYGTSSNSRFAAFLRHANKSNRLKGLYFCGGSVHPGGGIPLCLLSAKIASELCPKP
jgi:diapolycopene oxygenase